ncbi:pygopus [Sarcoptes scabiei]|nr:pygopus [Sarcoptes scabiei]
MEIKESMKSGSSYEKKSPYDMNETKGEPKSKSSGLTDMKTSTQVSTPKRLNEIDDVFAKMDTAKILNNIKSNSARKPISRDVSNKINSQTPASKRGEIKL